MSNFKSKSKNNLVENFIFFCYFVMLIFLKSLKTLSKIFSYGIFKKEILTTKSNLGFDIKIKIK